MSLTSPHRILMPLVQGPVWAARPYRFRVLQVKPPMSQLFKSVTVVPKQPWHYLNSCAWLCSNKTLQKQVWGQIWPPGSSLPTPAVGDGVWAQDRLSCYCSPCGLHRICLSLPVPFFKKYMPLETYPIESAYTQCHFWRIRTSEYSSHWTGRRSRRP